MFEAFIVIWLLALSAILGLLFTAMRMNNKAITEALQSVYAKLKNK